MAAKSKASALWHKDLLQGSGTVKFDSGGLPEAPVTWASRTERAKGRTSPEELLAGSYAACFAMAFSAALGRMGKPPEELAVEAVATFDKVGDAWKVTTMEVDVKGKVPGMSAAEFSDAAHAAEKGCPISNVIRGNVAVHLKATLA